MKAPHPELTSDLWEQAKEIVADALEIPDAAERSRYIAESCASNGALQAEVDSLLGQPTTGFDERVENLSQSRDEALAPGVTLGRYQIDSELARGGMGVVYLAHRADGEFDKRVAVKVLKRGIDSDEIVKRFSAERQILARLEHPNIARLLDAGTMDGVPYFVMEYVDGLSIATFARERELSIKDRITLVLDVCAGVSYAHRNLVIHRDLKPGNVLVTQEGQVKLLDFGIAKLVQEAGEGAALATMTIQPVMTPDYASPEQLAGKPVTTVSDVYSLGILLYEILAGERPLRNTRAQLGHNQHAADIAKPSTVVARASSNRRLLARHLRGELDNIVLQAAKAEPERRYRSVDELADDLRRYLDGRPVRARPDTFSYRATKFIRRNKLAAAVAAAFVLALVTGIVATSWEARRASREAARAKARFEQVRQLAHSMLFEYHDQIAALPGATRVRERLVSDALKYLDNLRRDAGNDEGLLREIATAYAKVGEIQGNSYHDNLGDTAGAIDSYRNSFAIREKLVAAKPNDLSLRDELADSYDGLGDMAYTVGDLHATLGYYEKAQPLRESVHRAQPDNLTSSLALAELYGKLGDLKGMERYSNLGDVDGALASYKQSEALLNSLLARYPSETRIKSKLANLLYRLGFVAGATGDSQLALQTGRRAIALFDEMIAADPQNQPFRLYRLAAAAFLRSALVADNQLTEAITSSRDTIVQLEQMLRADATNAHLRRSLGVTYNALSEDLLRVGDVPVALDSARKAVAVAEAAFAANSSSEEARSDLANAKARLGSAYAAGGDDAAAIELFRAAVSLREGSLRIDSSNARSKADLSDIRAALARSLCATHSYNEAADEVTHAVAAAEELVAASRANVRRRSAVALRYADVGYVHEQIARAASANAAEWQMAREFYAKSAACWNALANEKKLVRLYADKPSTLQKDVERCDSALLKPAQPVS